MNELIKKYREIIVYIIAGVLTTIVYYIVRFCAHIVVDNSVICAAFAQITAIIFAFFINRIWVFQDKEKNVKKIIIQGIKFAAGRAVMFVFDLLTTYICIERFPDFFISLFKLESIDYDMFPFRTFPQFIGSAPRLNEFIITTFIQVVTIVVNYIFSKLIVFAKNKKNK